MRQDWLLQCVGVLAEALHGAWKPYAAALIEPMILMGLSPTLVLALQVHFVTHVPSFPTCLLFVHLLTSWTEVGIDVKDLLSIPPMSGHLVKGPKRVCM